MAEHKENPHGELRNFDGEEIQTDHPDAPVDGTDQDAAEASDQGSLAGRSAPSAEAQMRSAQRSIRFNFKD